MLGVTGPEATSACQGDQLCDGLIAGIGGAFHMVQDIWGTKLTTEDWGFLTVYAKNAFNDINLIRVLWTVQNVWPYGACFVFNWYCHWSSLVLWNGNWAASFLHSREEGAQVGALAMVTYGIGILPLIKNFKTDFPDVTHP